MRTGTNEVIKDADRELILGHSVQITQLKRGTSERGLHDDAIRVYGGPAMGAVIQLRALGGIGEFGAGMPRRMIATAQYVSADEIDCIIATLQDIRATMK